MTYDGFPGKKSAISGISDNPAGRLIELSWTGLLIKLPSGSSV